MGPRVPGFSPQNTSWMLLYIAAAMVMLVST
jgi:hypothetical protein